MALPSMTLAELRTAVRQRADQVNSEFVSDDELNSYINESLYSLYDLLVTSYGEDYYASESSATTDGTQFVDLPPDFYKLLGVDYLPDGTNRVTLRRFDRTERNRATWPYTQTYPWFNIRYRLRADKLWLTPTPQTGLALRIIYVPRLKQLADPLEITVASTIVAGDAVTFTFYDGDGVLQTATLVADTDFLIALEEGTGDVDTALTAENLKDAILGNTPLAAYREEPFSGETGTDASVTVQNNDETQATSYLQTGTVGLSFSGGYQSQVLNASSVYGAVYIVPTEANLQSDGISGWLEYVIVDAAIKCMQKEESDTRVLQGQRQGLVQRIINSASNRDAAEPQRVADVTRTGGWPDWDDPFGFGGGGGWW